MSASTWGGQPYPVEVERAVIGAAMRDNKVLSGASIRLLPDHFSVARHQAVWRAALTLVEAGQRANPLTLRRALVDDDKVVDLRPDLASMAAEAAAPDFVDQYAAHIVRAFSLKGERR